MRRAIALMCIALLTGLGTAMACSSSNNGPPPLSTSDASSDSALSGDAGPGPGDAPAVDSPTIDSGPVCNATPCVVGVAAGSLHNCALLSDQSVRCWGNNIKGQLGSGVPEGGGVLASATPVPVVQLPASQQVSASATSGALHESCALSVAGAVECWGDNTLGHLGEGDASAGDPNPHPVPSRVSGLPAIGYVAAATYNDFAVTPGGQAWSWGSDQFGQLVQDASSITSGPGPCALGGAVVTRVGAGLEHACALAQGGEVLCWGMGLHGQLGLRDGGGVEPAPVSGLMSAADLGVGREFNCVAAQGKVQCWGLNATGQLGVVGPDSAMPMAVPLPPGRTAVQVTAAVGHACALLDDRTVACWGSNLNGESGVTPAADGGFQTPVRPTVVSGVANALLVTAGGSFNVMSSHTCALIEGGAVLCWGSNSDGQLGRGPEEGGVVGDLLPHPVPAPVAF